MKKNFFSFKLVSFFMPLLLVLFSFPLKPEEIAKYNLDDPTSLSTTVAIDSKIKFEGLGAAKITTDRSITIPLIVVDNITVEEAKLLYQAKVKSEKLQGNAYLEMWCSIDNKEYFSRGLKSVIEGTSDWKTLETPFILEKGQVAKKATLNIVVNGKGTVWVDDIKLLKEPLE